MPTAVLRELPKCDICKELDLPTFNDATADSLLNTQSLGHSRNIWGYSCGKHAHYRMGAITTLTVAS